MEEKSDRDRFGAFIGRPSVMDIGLGVLYFFTSHMVIRAMYYIGIDRTTEELALFFLVVLGGMVATHLFSRAFLRLRRIVESAVGVPAVSVMAAFGATLALVSMLPSVHVLVFYCSGALLGASCAWIVVIWTSTIYPKHPDQGTFYVQPSLLIAVGTYFAFRCVSTVSETISQGFLLALPLVAILCILRSYNQGIPEFEEGTGENGQALQVLVVVAAVFAIGCDVVVHVSGKDGVLFSGLNDMALFEVLAVVLIAFCCGAMARFCRIGQTAFRSLNVLLVFLACCVPTFLMGLMMGGAGVPETSPDAMWEANMWVLLIAIFAYDIRESLYAVKGLAVGLMFEAMCIGQLVAKLAAFDFMPWMPYAAVLVTVLYFASMWWQLRHVSRKRVFDSSASLHAQEEKFRAYALLSAGAQGQGPSDNTREALCELSGAPHHAESHDAKCAPQTPPAPSPSAELAAYCEKVAQEHGLTPRETEILGLMAMGRSATYMAEELTLSHNTVRTHIKHVYEKLNIHSKQELIDLVVFGPEHS